jgi:hypothetical protein
MFAFTQNPARLSNSQYSLFMIQHYRIVRDGRTPGSFKVKTLRYQYNIERSNDAQELICFHWEGDTAKNPVPHIHIGFAAKPASCPFGNRTHIPSGRVALEDVVSFVIAELQVEPTEIRRHTWQPILQAARDVFFRFKSW